MSDKVAEIEDREERPLLEVLDDLIDVGRICDQLEAITADLRQQLASEIPREAKQVIEWKLREALRTLLGYREHTEAPFPDAKMNLVWLVKHYGKLDEPRADRAAVLIAAQLIQRWPALAPQLRNDERLRLLAAAVGKQRSNRSLKKKPTAWSSIAAAWAGIEARSNSAETPGRRLKDAWTDYRDRKHKKQREILSR